MVSDVRAAKFYYSPTEFIHFRVRGTGARQILMLHGFAASLHTWDDLLPLFSFDEVTVHRLDLKGHGDSSKNCEDYSPYGQSLVVAAYIRKYHLVDVVLIGHSLGGAIGLLTALVSPQVVSLALIGAPAFPQPLPRGMRLLKLPWWGAVVMYLLPAGMVARAGLKSVFFRPGRITTEHLVRYARCYHGYDSARALAYTVRQMVPDNMQQIADSYLTLQLPTLLLWGEHDRIIKPLQGEKLHRHLKRSRLVVIPDCGHNPHEELPETTYGLIHDFLGKN